MNEERNLLIQKANFLRKLLIESGFNTGMSNSHIVPIIFSDEEKVLKLKEYFLNENIIVSAIRPPTVQKSCIRVGLNIDHSEDELRKFVNLMKKLIYY